LPHETQFTQEGVPGLFSLKAFNTAWTEYQQGLVEKLSSLTAGMEKIALPGAIIPPNYDGYEEYTLI
jgi:superoxide dismutase